MGAQQRLKWTEIIKYYAATGNGKKLLVYDYRKNGQIINNYCYKNAVQFGVQLNVISSLLNYSQQNKLIA